MDEFTFQSAVNLVKAIQDKKISSIDFQSYNDVYGQTNNPWDVSKAPGGSSGGAAAALAAGLTGLEIGSDAGGSIRNPAHFCGVYGHRPSINIVPLRGHIPPAPDIFPGEYTLDVGLMEETTGGFNQPPGFE